MERVSLPPAEGYSLARVSAMYPQVSNTHPWDSILHSLLLFFFFQFFNFSPHFFFPRCAGKPFQSNPIPSPPFRDHIPHPISQTQITFPLLVKHPEKSRFPIQSQCPTPVHIHFQKPHQSHMSNFKIGPLSHSHSPMSRVPRHQVKNNDNPPTPTILFLSFPFIFPSYFTSIYTS